MPRLSALPIYYTKTKRKAQPIEIHATEPPYIPPSSHPAVILSCLPKRGRDTAAKEEASCSQIFMLTGRQAYSNMHKEKHTKKQRSKARTYLANKSNNLHEITNITTHHQSTRQRRIQANNTPVPCRALPQRADFYKKTACQPATFPRRIFTAASVIRDFSSENRSAPHFYLHKRHTQPAVGQNQNRTQQEGKMGR